MTRWGITRKESICLTCLTSPTRLVGMKWGGSCTILRDFSPIVLFLILGGLLFVWGVLYGMLLDTDAAHGSPYADGDDRPHARTADPRLPAAAARDRPGHRGDTGMSLVRPTSPRSSSGACSRRQDTSCLVSIRTRSELRPTCPSGPSEPRSVPRLGHAPPDYAPRIRR